MALSYAAKLEHELLEKVSTLSSAQKREALDFVEFIASRSRKSRNRPHRLMHEVSQGSLNAIIGDTPNACPLDAIIDIAIDCRDTDLSTNHDKYLYGDDPL
ncbi:MAG: hypothetical protein WCP20_24540 [Desulfuromonadales bacterium]